MARLAAFLPKLTEYPLDITVKHYVEKRSSDQNARLFKLHTLAAEITGYDVLEMHEEALCHHFGFVEKPVKSLLTGKLEMKRVPLKRSSQRDKVEFSKFMEGVSMWYAAELGVWLE